MYLWECGTFWTLSTVDTLWVNDSAWDAPQNKPWEERKVWLRSKPLHNHLLTGVEGQGDIYNIDK